MPGFIQGGDGPCQPLAIVKQELNECVSRRACTHAWRGVS